MGTRWSVCGLNVPWEDLRPITIRFTCEESDSLVRELHRLDELRGIEVAYRAEKWLNIYPDGRDHILLNVHSHAPVRLPIHCQLALATPAERLFAGGDVETIRNGSAHVYCWSETHRLGRVLSIGVITNPVAQMCFGPELTITQGLAGEIGESQKPADFLPRESSEAAAMPPSAARELWQVEKRVMRSGQGAHPDREARGGTNRLPRFRRLQDEHWSRRKGKAIHRLARNRGKQ